MKKIKVSAPATVANVCCGFDILGFSVDAPGDEVILTLTGKDVVMKSITGDGGRLPMESNKNTASVAVQSYLNAIGESAGVEIELIKNLPLGSGMGSSAASAVAALVAINAFFGDRLTRQELIPHAMEAERIACGAAHADNVAPSLLGGFVLVRGYHPLDVVRVPLTAKLFCTLVHPHLELKTEDSRRVLKPTISLKDAITQNGNTAGLMVGLMSSDYDLISRSLHDVIAEPVRSVFIPGFDKIRAEVKQHGALGCGISGSGPTLFALSKDKETATQAGQLIEKHFLSAGLKSESYVSEINLQGAKIVG
ncbi:MAG TPA: homoserine kinase [Cyclobacteriaceae bacterium]